MKKIIAILLVGIFLASLVAGIKRNERYDLLIICPDEFYTPLIPFISHKENHGIKTVVAKLNEVYNHPSAKNARDDAEKVKYFIKNAYDEWKIKYVLLIGGRKAGLKEEWYMPVRYVYLDDKSNWENRYLSDLYFADIYDANGNFSSWDTNNNGYYGEWIGNNAEDYGIDLVPDVSVGRWAAQNAFEVEIMVSKTIEYETNTYGKNWFKKFICVAGDTYPEIYNSQWKGYEGEEGCDRAIQWMPGFEPIRLYTSLGTFTGPKDVINAINSGAGFLFFDGHGSPMSWATHAPNSEEWIDGLNTRNMIFLRNKGMYPVCVVGGCHNSQFNITIFNWLRIFEGFNKWIEYIWKGETGYECWSWWLTRKINGGAIATIGNTGLGYHGSEDENKDGIPDYLQILDGWLEINFFRIYNEGVNILGMLHSQTLKEFIDYFPGDVNMPLKNVLDVKVVQEWLLLGDPTLRIGGYQSLDKT